MDLNVLIREVHKRQPLWDQRHSDHHNRFVLDKFWDEVAAKLKCTSELDFIIFLQIK